MSYGYTNGVPDQAPTSPTSAAASQKESYIQRMKRMQGAQSSAYSSAQPGETVHTDGGITPPPANMSTPVTGDGKIPPPAAPPAPPAPAAAPAPAPAPPPPTYNGGAVAPPEAGPDPFQGNGFWTGAQWVPKDHPLAAQSQAAAQATATAPGGGPAGPYNVAAPQVGIPSNPAAQLPESYQGSTFTQYQAPQHQAQNQQQLDLISRLLANPQTQSPQVIEQMKQKQMEEQLLMGQQYNQQAQDNLAARGFSVGGGQADAARRASQDSVMSAILGQNRDIEIGAANQNRTDELNALNASEGILQGQQVRGGEIYNNTLKGQGMQAEDKRMVSQDAINRSLGQFGADMDTANFGLGVQQANRGDYWTGQQLGLQRELGVGGLGIDQQRVNNQDSQFGQNHALNVLGFLEGQRTSNNNLGFNYDQLNSNNNNTMMQTIMSMLGGR